jgi:5,10-methylenetetrahydromethanopterin reductase
VSGNWTLPLEDALTELPGLGVVVSPHLAAGDYLAYVKRVEDLGFDEAWIVEDCFLHGAFAQAASALAATASMRVGLGIIPAGARNVVFAAMEIATLAGLHPGRLTVGVGHGIPGWMARAGAWPASPLGLLEEYVLVLRRLLAGEEVSFAGRYVRVKEARLVYPPAIVPPVYLGVRGPRSLRLSGMVAEGTVLAEPVTPEYLAFARERIGAEGHRIVAYNLAAVGESLDSARALVRGALAVVGEPDGGPHVAVLDFGGELTALRERAGSGAAFAAALPDEWVDRLAIAGPLSVVSERLAELGRAGADQVALIPAGPDRVTALKSLGGLRARGARPTED